MYNRRVSGNEDFLDALPCHLPPDAGSLMRSGIIRERIRAIARFATTVAPEETPTS